MSEQEQEQTAEEREQARLDRSAAENEQVRRAEHPEEFVDEGEPDGSRMVAPVAPASGTGTTEQHRMQAGQDGVQRRADDLSTLERLEARARELRKRLFEEPTL